MNFAFLLSRQYRLVMDFNSIEFYTIAFILAIALVALLFRQKQWHPAQTHIVPLDLNKTDLQVDRDDKKELLPAKLRLTALDDGKVMVERENIPLREEETVNLIATVVDDKITIEEKKGMVAALGGREFYSNGCQTLAFIPADKVYIRYESAVAGRWAKFAFLNREGNKVEHELAI